MRITLPVLLLIAFFAASHDAFAGGVRGFIRDAEGKPLEFATIYVAETGSGASANERGFYELRLDPGSYTLVFQYLGYRAESRKVTVDQLFQEINITLGAQALELKTVEVYEGREDPAYTVMRKAIAKASYHRQQVDHYTAQVYIKGSGGLKKIPFLARKALREEGIDTSTVYTSESVSIIEYTRPSTFKERVISVYQNGEDNSTSPNSFVFGSFYEPTIADVISPLSTKAFGYYKFKLEGYFVDRGYGVNKISVTPRSRGENVFEGTIYIVEDLWSIHSLSLKTYKFGIGFLVNQIYAPILDNVWMPVTQKFDVDGKILGFGFEYNYLANVSDYKITLNPDLDVDFNVIDEKLEKEMAADLARQKKENPKTGDIKDKLSSGDELTRKDLRKLMREYEKDEKKEAQEEPNIVVAKEYSVDTLASKRDSAYWAQIRPMPLTQKEVRSYAKLDSIAREEKIKEEVPADSTQTLGKKKHSNFSLTDIVSGGSYPMGKTQRLSFDSPLLGLNFNPVEGFNVKTDITYRSYSKTDDFRIIFTPRYAFAREKLTGKGRIAYRYGPRGKKTDIALEGGRYINQYNAAKPISELINSFTCLFNERNYLSLYEKDYLQLSYAKTLAENWNIRGYIERARRYTMVNNTTQTWFNKDDRTYLPNIPEIEEVDEPLKDGENALVFSIGIEGRPWQKYRLYNGRKEAINNSSPRVGLNYRKGIKGILDSEVNYDLLDLTFQHKFRAGARGLIDFKVNAGIFLNNDYVGFADFKHFMGNRVPIATSDPVGSFRLLDYYRNSTMDKYAAVHLHYQFRKFLFTQIPEVWIMGIKENLFVNYLATPTSKNYTEVGYSIDNIFRIFRIEAAVSFRDGKYEDWGILLGIASNLGFIRFD